MDVSPSQVETLAKIVHQANKAFCEEEGDNSQKDWEKISDDMKDGVIDGVEAICKNPSMTPEDSHVNWMKKKESQGWVYGKVKDEAKKTHPCMIPYKDLDDVQRYKDYLFFGIVKSFLDFQK